jgi:hypothetical protein
LQKDPAIPPKTEHYLGYMSENATTPEVRKPNLTFEQFQEIATAYGRLLDIKASVIKTPNHDAEAKGLVEFICNQMLEHAPEFLGAWVVLKNEYEPAVNALSLIFPRMHALHAQRVALSQPKSPAAPASEDTGIK